ncbi:MAG TPA: DUF2231 domain-containing protein [Chitinophagaceae bacterium]|nr:DUF2231 domain-containing protein [Chitinophagaceae bacterium]
MNPAQIHLALNHAPLFLSIIGGLLLLLGLIRKNESYKTISLYMLVAAGLFTIPVYLTGEGTEELVENLPGVNEAAIGEHEEMAKISLVIIAVTGAVALAGLLLRKNAAVGKILIVAAVILSLASFGTMAQTAHLGGKIRHAEIGTAAANTGKGEGEQENEEEKEKSNMQQDKSPKDSIINNGATIKKADDDD